MKSIIVVKGKEAMLESLGPMLGQCQEYALECEKVLTDVYGAILSEDTKHKQLIEAIVGHWITSHERLDTIQPSDDWVSASLAASSDKGLALFGLTRDKYNNALKSPKHLEPYPQAKQGFVTDLPQHRDTQKGLEVYIYAFLGMWQGYIEAEGKFRWRVLRSDDQKVAVVFTTQAKDDDLPPLQGDEDMWADLKRIVELSRWKLNPGIPTSGLLARVVTDDEIIIIKRSERRLWTRSQAYEDTRETFWQAMGLQDARINP